MLVSFNSAAMEVKFGYGQLHRADVSSRQASKLLPEDCGWIIETEDTPVRFVCVDTTSPNENLQYLLTRSCAEYLAWTIYCGIQY